MSIKKIGGHMWFPEFKKTTGGFANATSFSDSTQRLKDFLKSLPQKPKNKLDERELDFLNSLSFLPTGQINQGQQPAPYQQLEKVQLLEKTAPKTEDKKENLEDNLKTEAEVLKKQLEEAKLAQTFQKMGSAQYETAHVKALELEKLLQEVQSQKLTLENQIIELRKKLEMKNQNVFAPSVAQPKIQTQTVRRVPKELVKSLGLPLIADVPNLIAGIIKRPKRQSASKYFS